VVPVLQGHRTMRETLPLTVGSPALEVNGPPNTGRKRYIVCPFEDANDPESWSGTPYYFLRACKAEGLLDEALPMLAQDDVGRLTGKVLWNLKRALTEGRLGGYWYSERSFEDVWAPILPRLEDAVAICCACPMPLSVSRNRKITKWLFIDQTSRQSLEDNCSSAVDARLRNMLYSRETGAYQMCEGIIAHSRWAASSVVADYEISRDKVYVVVPGANLDPAAYDVWHRNEAASAFIRRLQSPVLRVVFCGHDDFYRKGLDRLIEGVSWAKANGFRGRLSIYGRFPEAVTRSYSTMNNIEFAGSINKEKEPIRFMQLLADNDVACLVSRKEAGGTVLREFAALGLPTIVTRVGGIPDHAIESASIMLPQAVTPEGIGETLLKLESDHCLRERLQRAAWDAHETALWPASISKFRTFWPYQSGEADKRTGAAMHLTHRAPRERLPLSLHESNDR